MSKTPGKIIPISLSEKFYKQLKEMAEHYGVSSAEVCRRGLSLQYENMLRQKFGYKGETLVRSKMDKEARAAQREDQMAWVRSADGPALTAYLIDCGYIEEPEFEQGDLIVRIVAEPNDAGILMLRQRFFIKATNEFSYASDLQTIEEVVKGLIKEKRI